MTWINEMMHSAFQSFGSRFILLKRAPPCGYYSCYSHISKMLMLDWNLSGYFRTTFPVISFNGPVVLFQYMFGFFSRSCTIQKIK